MSTKITSNKLISKKEIIFYYLSSVLLPNIFLFVLYNGNLDDAHIVFSHILFLGLIFSTIGAIGLLFGRLIVRNYEGSLLISLLFWSFFWFFEAIYARVPIISKNILLFIIIFIILSFAIALRFISTNFYKGRIIFSALAGVVCLLFTFNFFPAVFANMRETPEVATVEQADFYIKSDFNIDPTLPNPDIVWFHVDGMINFTDMLLLFDDPQDEFRQQLTERGFVINEDARIAGHNTYFNVPALFSPAFYDSYLGPLMAQLSPTALRRERRRFLHGAFERDGISHAVDIAPHHELFHALLQADYTTISIADFDERIFVPLDHFYRIGNMATFDNTPFTVGSILEVEDHLLIDALELIELLTLTTPIPYRFVLQARMGNFNWVSIPTHEEEVNRLTADTRNLSHERQLYRRLIDSLSTEGPKLTHITPLFTHIARWHWQYDGLGRSDTHTDMYPTAHAYTVYMLITMIDMILEQNPNTVIVIQSDHGFHLDDIQTQLLEDGFSEAEVASLQNSVMSAVRIPEQYGGLDVPLNPLNITRELVNRFVGPNYQLLPE